MDKSSNTLAHISPHWHITMDFTTTSGKHLRIRVPLTLFDNLSLKIGNGYKAGCWIAARCNEVERLSHETIERYVNMMARRYASRSLCHALRYEPASCSSFRTKRHAYTN